MGTFPLKTPTFRELARHPIDLLAFGFGAGLSRVAPGTVGSLVGVIFLLFASSLSVSWYLLITGIVLVVGIWLCDTTARRLGAHDHPGIVWDEITGYLITMIGIPKEWLWIAAGFAVFRLLDILKPWPINMIDRKVTGGLGIMLDDVAAGILGCGLLHFAYFLL